MLCCNGGVQVHARETYCSASLNNPSEGSLHLLQAPALNSAAAAAAGPPQPPEVSPGSGPLPLPEGWVHADQPAAVAPMAWQGHQPGPQPPPGHPAAFAAPPLGMAMGKGAAPGGAGPGMTPHRILPSHRGPPPGSNQVKAHCTHACNSVCVCEQPAAPHCACGCRHCSSHVHCGHCECACLRRLHARHV